MIAQEIVFTRDFLTERNSRAYFRAKKIPCGNKNQARARVAGEKCGLDLGSALFQGEPGTLDDRKPPARVHDSTPNLVTTMVGWG